MQGTAYDAFLEFPKALVQNSSMLNEALKRCWSKHLRYSDANVLWLRLLPNSLWKQIREVVYRIDWKSIGEGVRKIAL